MSLNRVLKAVLIVIVVGVAGSCVLSSCLMGAKRPVEQAVAALLRDLSVDGNWSGETFYAHATPEFRRVVPADELEQKLQSLRSLGYFKGLHTDGFRYKAFAAEPAVAEIEFEAEFERRPKQVRMRLRRIDGEWLVEWFSFD